MVAARAKAERAGRGRRRPSVGKVLTIDEGGDARAPRVPKAARMTMAADSAPIEAGEHELEVSVTVSYRLTT